MGMAGMTPEARTIAYLNRLNVYAEKVTWWAHGRFHDPLGFMDVLALPHGYGGSLAIQATTLSNVSARVKKIRALETAAKWLDNGNRIEVWGWSPEGCARERLRVVRIERVGRRMKAVEL
jgi:hypothetical protein